MREKSLHVPSFWEEGNRGPHPQILQLPGLAALGVTLLSRSQGFGAEGKEIRADGK